MAKQTHKQPAKAAKSSQNDEAIKVITVNRQAYHEYTVERTIEAGIALVGTEIKSIRDGKVNLR
ncbi:MAG TPA: SsrA-binding protein, partial [Ktedonobacteraceae bacterium]|nr:SsrA-binding protein [Ktedonobacteraceae bacterium]